MEDIKVERNRFKELESKNPPVQYLTVNLGDLQDREKKSIDSRKCDYDEADTI